MYLLVRPLIWPINPFNVAEDENKNFKISLYYVRLITNYILYIHKELCKQDQYVAREQCKQLDQLMGSSR